MSSPREGLAAIVVAGGYSSRMQAFKPLLPLGDATVLERAVTSFLDAGVTDVSVVAGHRGEALRDPVERLGARWVENPAYAQGMFTSVVTGVRSLVPHARACFFLPADMPAVRASTVAALARAFEHADATVLYPTFDGHRGHPPLISARLFPAILTNEGSDGLRGVLATRDGEAREVPVLDEGVLVDLDTPEDLERARRTFTDRSVPTRAECAALLAEAKVPERVRRHGDAVATLACHLAERLNRAGLTLDLALIAAAGRVHDLAKGSPDHASAGARELRRLGFPRLAEVVGAHTDLDLVRGVLVDESAVVYLADKLVLGDRVVGLGERFGAALERCRDSEHALATIARRRADAVRVACAVEALLGVDLATWLATDRDDQEARLHG